MAIIEWKKDGTVAVMTMNTSENRHNPDFNRAILGAFDEIEGDEEISSVVITSQRCEELVTGDRCRVDLRRHGE